MLATNVLQDRKKEEGIITVDQEIVNKWPLLLKYCKQCKRIALRFTTFMLDLFTN